MAGLLDLLGAGLEVVNSVLQLGLKISSIAAGYPTEYRVELGDDWESPLMPERVTLVSQDGDEEVYIPLSELEAAQRERDAD